MTKYDNKFPLTGGINPWIAIPVILLFSGGVMIILSQIALFLIKMLFGINQTEFYFMIQQQDINDSGVWALFLFQAFSALGGFIVGPLLYINLLDKHPLAYVFSKSGITGTAILLIVTIVLTFMIVNAVVLKWNMEFEFPGFLEEFERWAKQKEDEAARLTRNLTLMPTGSHLLVAFFVIAILPSIGEELLFRGLIQNKLYAGIGNIHIAIWLTGILFSAIHFQFYGFVPRMLLGVLFGYLYFWSANLWIPIIAHFINNGFTIVGLYFNQQGVVEYDLESPPDIPLSTFMIFLGINIALIWYFYQYYRRREIEKEMNGGAFE